MPITFTTLPAAPTNTSATGASTSEITVTWTDNSSDEDGYRVYHSSDGSTYSKIADLSPNTTNYTHSGLGEASKNWYYIAAYNESGENEGSTISGWTEPAAPTSLTTTWSDGVSLGWTDNSGGEFGYKVYESTASSPTFPGDYSEIADLGADVVSHNRDIVGADTYHYAVTAYTESESSESSASISLVEKTISETTTLPDVPTPTVSSPSENTISTSWSGVTNNGSYRVQFREFGESSWDSNAVGFTESTVGYSSTSMDFNSLSDGEKYESRLRSETDHVTGSWSGSDNATTTLPSPSSPTLSVNQSSVDISWTDIWDGEDGVKIFREVKTQSGFTDYTQVGDVDPGVTSFTDWSAYPGREYQYKIRAYTDHTHGESSYDIVELDPKFVCGKGGVVTVLSDYIDVLDVKPDGQWIKFGDVYLNSATDYSLGLSGSHVITAKVEHLTGDSIVKFNLVSRSPNGKADIRVENLKPEAWYRLQFEGSLVETDGGMSHGKTSADGVIQFNGVSVPDT